ncbi:universal stress protein [soil metagenome]
MKIILATDGTEYADAAVEMFGKFNLSSGDEVKIINVVDMALPMSIDVYGGYLPDTSVLETAARESAEKVISETAAKLGAYFAGKDILISGDVLFGSPDSRIVETSEDLKADLIIIGSHGYKRWERLLLGSVSDSVVHHAHCSVLVVRSPAV